MRLIAAATEGSVPPSRLERLVEHLSACASCGVEATSQLAVKRFLASRPDESLPPGLARRIADRIAEEAAKPPSRIRTIAAGVRAFIRRLRITRTVPGPPRTLRLVGGAREENGKPPSLQE